METQQSTQNSSQKPMEMISLLDNSETVSDESQSDSSETQTCKYCNETGGEMVKPCQCNDSVHYTCLDTWQKSRQTDKDKCEICQTQYYGNMTVNYRKCVSDFLIYICLVLLNIFTMVGCAGYDLVQKYLSDKEVSPFSGFIFGMFIMISLFYIVVLFLFYIIYIGEQNINQRKHLQYFFIFHIVVQIIPVIICSSILGTFFWNITTFGMGISVVSATIILCMIIMLGVTIFQRLRQYVKSKYGKIQFSDNPTVTI